MLLLQKPIYADDHLEEEFEINDMNAIFQTVGAEIEDMPQINARHAVVYERTSRSNIVWKKGERKVQNGFDHKNHVCIGGIGGARELRRKSDYF